MEFFKIHRDIPFMRHALVFNLISFITFFAAVFFTGGRVPVFLAGAFFAAGFLAAFFAVAISIHSIKVLLMCRRREEIAWISFLINHRAARIVLRL